MLYGSSKDKVSPFQKQTGGKKYNIQGEKWSKTLNGRNIAGCAGVSLLIMLYWHLRVENILSYQAEGVLKCEGK